MAHSEKISSGPGSIADTASRLINWSKRGSWGLARIEYISEFARERVLNDLRYALAEAYIPFTEIELPPNQSASEVVQYLIKHLQKIESGVVSVTGFATAFSTEVLLEDSLRILNFNRENIALPNLRQIWWMPSNFAEVFVSAVPDLDSWFTVRLHLAEVIPAIRLRGQTPFLQHRNPVGWNMPPRNPFFTGRNEVLDKINTTLYSQKVVWLNGVGGMGKTQTAVEYAYKYWNNYQVVLWAAADTEPSLTSGMAEIANVLGLPEAREVDQTVAAKAVRRWLQANKGWLLILDEVVETRDELTSLLSLPSNGHILLTSRARIFDNLSVGSYIQLAEMTQEEALNLLCKRAGHKQVDRADKHAADKIVSLLDHLPLAIELAGAYVRERQVGYHDYLITLTERLNKSPNLQRKYDNVLGHLFAALDINSSASKEFSDYATELLRISSFLYPDNIPVELFMWADPKIQKFGDISDSTEGRQFAIYELLNILARNSLIYIDGASQTFSVHRLLQTLMRENLEKSTQRLWVEKTIQIVSHIFPYPEVENWVECERVLQHALVCADHIKNWKISSTEAVSLLVSLGSYLQSRGRYATAEPILRQALETVSALEEKDSLREIPVLGNLAAVYYAQGRYKEAEYFYNRVLELQEQALGAKHPVVAGSLRNLARISVAANNYGRAEALLRQALEIELETLGEEHPVTAKTFNQLASLGLQEGRYEEAEQYFKQALRIGERALGSEHPVIIESLQGLANLYLLKRNYAQSKQIYERVLDLDKRSFWNRDPKFAEVCNNLAFIYINEHSYQKAESLLQQALDIELETFGEEHPVTARTLRYLAFLWLQEGRYEQAESALKKALRIQEKYLGASHPDLANTLGNYATLLRYMKREEEAEELELRARRITPK